MGRKKLWGGAAQIDRAEQFFRETRDYKYVALAIGSRPLDPPKWAMWACVKLRLKTEAIAALGRNTQHIDAMLDTAIWFLAQHQTEHFEKCQAIGDPLLRAASIDALKPMPLRRAFTMAMEYWQPELAEKANEQPVATLDALKKAWKREMQEELVEAEKAGLEHDGPTLEGFPTTHRIARVLMKYHAANYPEDSPHFYDPDLLIWIGRDAEVL